MGFIVDGAFISKETGLELKTAFVSPPRNSQIGTFTKRYKVETDTNVYDTTSIFYVYHDKDSRGRGAQHLERIHIQFTDLTYEEYEAQTASDIYAKLFSYLTEKYEDCVISSDEIV